MLWSRLEMLCRDLDRSVFGGVDLWEVFKLKTVRLLEEMGEDIWISLGFSALILFIRA